jgi:hypothetical protein
MWMWLRNKRDKNLNVCEIENRFAWSLRERLQRRGGERREKRREEEGKPDLAGRLFKVKETTRIR